VPGKGGTSLFVSEDAAVNDSMGGVVSSSMLEPLLRWLDSSSLQEGWAPRRRRGHGGGFQERRTRKRIASPAAPSGGVYAIDDYGVGTGIVQVSSQEPETWAPVIAVK
jgi:hypothetical protein